MKKKIEGFIEISILYLFRYPGSFIRWAAAGFQKSFRDIIEKDAFLNAVVGLVAVVLMLVIKRMLW